MASWSDLEADRHFRAQFEPDGERFLFRYGRRGGAVPVTRQEMDESIALYRRRSRLVRYAGLSLIMAEIFLTIIFGGDFIDRDGAIWLLVLIWLLPFSAAIMWAWKSPTRHFVQRTSITRERSRSEVRGALLAEWSWSRILLPLGAGVMLIGYHIMNWPPPTIEGWIWFGFGVFFVIASAFNGVAKLSAGSNSA